MSAAGDRLTVFYRKALEEIIASLDKNIFGVPANPRHLVLIAETKKILKDLNAASGQWADQMIRSQYGKNIKFVNDFLKAKGYTSAELEAARSYATIHEEVIETLLNDPLNGITPRLQRVATQLGVAVESYVKQNKLLLKQNRMLRERVAMSVFMGTGAKEARDDILSSLMKTGTRPPAQYMGLDAWPGGSAAKTLVDAPYLQVMTKNGPRRLHIFDHVQMTATTTENAVRTEARNNRIKEMGIRLVRVSPNPPLTPCVCSLYAGRVFALDKEISAKTGFPLLADTPNGGPPFHPYCTHTTMPFIPDKTQKGAVKDAIKNGDKKGTRTVTGGFPKALVGKDFSEAQKYFKKRGGIRYAVRQNPQIKSYSGSRMADPEVKKALKGRKRRVYRANDGRGLGSSDLPSAGSPTGSDVLEDLT